MYNLFEHATFESCDPDTSISSVCTTSTDGLDVLDSLSQSFPLLSTKNYTGQDIVVLVCIGLFYKIMYIIGVLYKTSQVATIHDEPPPANLYDKQSTSSSHGKSTPAAATATATSLGTGTGAVAKEPVDRVAVDA